MLTLAVEAWIGNAAAVLSGAWGAVTRRAEQSGYSRTAIYGHAKRVVQAVVSEQVGSISYEEIWTADELGLCAFHGRWLYQIFLERTRSLWLRLWDRGIFTPGFI
jgi:hypothetical protein